MDEDIQAKLLVSLLRKAGHDVRTINELNLMGTQDSLILDYAKQENRVLLTRNCQDFQALHEANSNHAGILAIYQDSNSSKSMTFQKIVKAINNLEDGNIPLNNQFIALNHWSY